MAKSKTGEQSKFVRARRETPFVQIDKRPLNDELLSWKAKGILAYILSLPDDWELKATELTRHARDGEDSTLSGVKELISAGYIERTTIREGGKFAGYEYRVFEVLQPNREKPETVEPHPDKPHPEKPGITNNHLNNKERNNNETPDDFEAGKFPPQDNERTGPGEDSAEGEDAGEGNKSGKKKRPKVLFAETSFASDFEAFDLAFKAEAGNLNKLFIETLAKFHVEQPEIDTFTLWQAVADWSKSKDEKRSDWISTARTFVRNSLKPGKNSKEFLKYAPGSENPANESLADTFKRTKGQSNWASL